MVNVRQLERWSSRYDWQWQCVERRREELAAAREAAKKEAASLARRRLRNAQLMQEAALTILSKAKLTEMDEEAARKVLAQASTFLEGGMRFERLELGEATEAVVIKPPSKPIHLMNDIELQDYISKLEQTDEQP